MGIRITCPNCNRQLNVKSFLAGRRGVCPDCKTKFDIPAGNGQKVTLIVEESESTVAVRKAEMALRHEAEQPPNLAAIAMQPLPEPLSPAAAAARLAVAEPAPQNIAPAVPVAPLPAAVPIASRPDPIAEAPHASWHLCSPTGSRYGPVVGEILRQWIAERRVTPDTLLWREGWPDWQRADAVLLEFASVAAPAMPGPFPAGLPAATIGAPVFPAAEPSVEPLFPVDSSRTRLARYRRSAGSNRGLIIALLIVAVLILAAVLGLVLARPF